MREKSATANPTISHPAGAVAEHWTDIASPAPWRLVYGPSHPVTDHAVTVRTRGAQHLGGQLSECVVEVSGLEFNTDQARELASALLQAAAELDGWFI